MPGRCWINSSNFISFWVFSASIPTKLMVNFSINYCWIKISWPKFHKVLLMWTNHNVYFQGNKCGGSNLSFPAVTDTFVSILALQASRITFLKNSSDYMTPPKTLPMGSDLPGGLISHSFSPHSHHAPLPSTFTLHAFLHAVPLPGMPFPFSSMVNRASSSALRANILFSWRKAFPKPFRQMWL